MYFKKAGAENTEAALKIAINAAKERNIKYIIIASTYGTTAKEAIKLFNDKDLHIVVVTHNTGFAEPGKQQFDEGIRKEIENKGGKIVTGTMPFRGIGKALLNKKGCSQEEIVANTLRMFCQGAKVCVEITMMAADAGYIPCEDVIAVAGTGRGADTVMIICARPANNLFEIKIREILAKPVDW